MPPAPPVVLLSIKPHYATLIEQGLKVVEFRRRFPRRIQSARVLFYVTAPVQQIQLQGEIDHVQRAAPVELWRDFWRLAGVGREQFDSYFEGREDGIALILRKIRRLTRPLDLASTRLRSIRFKPPQSLSVLPPDSALLRWVDVHRFERKVL
jgi:predicted transcriptional regulator